MEADRSSRNRESSSSTRSQFWGVVVRPPSQLSMYFSILFSSYLGSPPVLWSMLGGVATSSRFSKTTRPQNKRKLTSIPLKGDFIMYTAPIPKKVPPNPKRARLCFSFLFGLWHPSTLIWHLLGTKPFFCSVASFSTTHTCEDGKKER